LSYKLMSNYPIENTSGNLQRDMDQLNLQQNSARRATGEIDSSAPPGQSQP
jgi:hypothetical protein